MPPYKEYVGNEDTDIEYFVSEDYFTDEDCCECCGSKRATENGYCHTCNAHFCEMFAFLRQYPAETVKYFFEHYEGEE